MLADSVIHSITLVGAFALDYRKRNPVDEQHDVWSPQFVRSRTFDLELIGDVVDVVLRVFPIDVLKRVATLIPVDGLLDGFPQRQQVVCLLVGLHQAVEGDVGQSIDGSSKVGLSEIVCLPFEGDLGSACGVAR